MKRIRKFLIRSFALAMLAMLVVGGVLGGFGYKMYRDALAEQFPRWQTNSLHRSLL